MAISTEKKNKVKIRLEKHDITMIRARVGLMLDLSGSTKKLFLNGTMTEVNSRFVPIAMRMDDNGELDVKGFSNKNINLPVMTEDNCENYVEKNILPLSGIWGGTFFAESIKAFRDEWFPHTESDKVLVEKASFLGKMFGRKDIYKEREIPEHEKPLPAILYIETDGENYHTDQYETEKLLEEMKNTEMYIIFFAVGNEDFSFIRRMADKYPNVGFFHVQDLNHSNDDEIYDGLITEELATFLKRAIIV